MEGSSQHKGSGPGQGKLKDDGPDDMLGQVVADKYRLLERLDHRGHARVYQAEQMHVGRTVALKLAKWHLGKDDPGLQRLAWAAQTAALVEHPNVAMVYDFGTDGAGHVYLAMELCRGLELGQLVASDGPLEPELAVEVTRQILDGLVAAHERGVVHQALRPRYVMVDRDPPGTDRKVQVKLLGFGLGDWGLRMAEAAAAGRSSALSGLSRTGELDASGFAAPEVLQGGNVDHRADLYSVGVLLFHALTGKLPWQRLASADLPSRRWYEQALGRTLKGLPGYRAWRNFFGTALNPDPARRFDQAGHMLEALERAAAGHSDEVSQVAQLQVPFGRYRLIRMLAQGGMGELHLAKAEALPGLPRVFAIKMLRPELAAKKKFMEGFLEEAKLTSRLFHPNVLAVSEVGKVEDRFYMAMEYVVGKDCRRILARAKEDNLPIPVEVAIYIIREVSEALAYAHRIVTPKGMGLVHADVSPPNIVVSYEGAVKLIDFGLAKQAHETRGTSADALMGKLAYMSPEQSRNERLTGRTDLYSAALVLFELLTGERFHLGDSPNAIAQSVKKSTYRSACRLNPRVPAPVDRIMEKALAVDPQARYETAEAFRNDLSEVLARISPRMSCDRVGAYVRALFPAELKAETDLAMSLHSKAPTSSLETAISDNDRQALGGAWVEDDMTMPTLQAVSPDEPTDPKGKAATTRPGRRRIDPMARTVASMPGVRPEDLDDTEDLADTGELEDTHEHLDEAVEPGATTEPEMVPGKPPPSRPTAAAGKRRADLDETLPPFSTPWGARTGQDPAEFKATTQYQTPPEPAQPAEPGHAASTDKVALPVGRPAEPPSSRGRRFLITAVAALAVGGAAGAIVAFVFMRSSPDPSNTRASATKTAGKAKKQARPAPPKTSPDGQAAAPRKPAGDPDGGAANTRTAGGGTKVEDDAGSGGPARQPARAADGRAGSPAPTGRAKEMLARAASLLAKRGLTPDELPVFPKLNARYETWTRAAKDAKYEDAEKLMRRWGKRLASRNCRVYLITKIRWINKQLRSRKLKRADRKRFAREYKTTWAAARKKSRRCPDRSIMLGPFVKNLLQALAPKTP